MNQLDKSIHLYLGCDTNKGKLIGIRGKILFIETAEKQIEEYDVRNMGNTLFLYLRTLNDLTDEQSKQLIQEGFSIGRPYGYTFTNHGFVYLLSQSVDLFGFIQSGFAKDIKVLSEKDL